MEKRKKAFLLVYRGNKVFSLTGAILVFRRVFKLKIDF